MKKQFHILVGVSILALSFACGTTKSSSTSKGVGDTRTKKVEFYDYRTYLLEEIAKDSSYAYTSQNPVCVGGFGDENAVQPSRHYLNALLGPNGEETKYFRYGSCCAFKTPNGLINNTGLLDHYGVYWEGGDTVSIYINPYDRGNLYIPVGLRSRP